MLKKAEKNILLVEDDDMIAEAMVRALSKLGHHITAIVMTGREAVQAALKDHPDLVIMDIMLEGDLDGIMDGIQAGEEIEKHSTVPIIYMTAYPDKAAELEARGKVPLLKPFSIDELKTAIGAIFYKLSLDERAPKKPRSHPYSDKTDMVG